MLMLYLDTPHFLHSEQYRAIATSGKAGRPDAHGKDEVQFRPSFVTSDKQWHPIMIIPTVLISGPILERAIMNVVRYQPGGRMAQATSYSGILFLAGQVADGVDAEEQTQKILANISAILGANKASKSSILSTTIYVANINDYDSVNRAWDSWLDKDNPPARACVEAGLAAPEYLVEIQVIAAQVT